jgi:hypothetical protein
MAFKSEAQRAKFAELVKSGKMSQETFDTWQAETGDKKLPARVKSTKTATPIRRVRRTR